MIDTTTDEDDYIETFKVAIDGKDNEMFKIYKKDFTSNYSVNDIVITESTGCF